jgi:hypothetical protein
MSVWVLLLKKHKIFQLQKLKIKRRKDFSFFKFNEINFTNVNFEKDINLPENIQTLNNDIKKICNELPALNIVKDVSLLDYTIEQTEKFKRNKKILLFLGLEGQT